MAKTITVSADAEQKGLVDALRKYRAGVPLTQREERLARRYEQQQREKFGREYLHVMPKKDYLAAAGVANKVILEQAHRLALPWNPHEKTVDMAAMLAAFHRLIAENPKAFYRAANKAAMTEFFPGENFDWQDECFKERAWQLADQRKLRRGEMLDAAAVAEILGRIADRYSSFVEVLGKRFGEAAQRLALQNWEDQQADVERLLAVGDDHDSSNEAVASD